MPALPATPTLSRRRAAALLAGSLALPAWAQATVDVVIDLRELIRAGRFDPARDRVGIRGGSAPLDWARSWPAEPEGSTPGLFRTRLVFDAVPTQPVAYKFKLERADDPQGGWEEGPNRQLLLRPGSQTVQRNFGSLTAPVPPQRTGRIDRLAPQPSAFVSPREVQVWLPPGYEQDSTRRYPVLYMHDGQNLFDWLAAGAEWQLDETAQRLVLAGEVAPFIVVGVASNGDRMADHTPVPGVVPGLAGGRPVGGGAPRYARYLVDELKPLIDRRYRTLPGREHTAVGGSSLGGLVSAWLVITEPQVFGAALVVSPAVWWNDEALLKNIPPAPQPPPRIWLDVGLREPGQTVPATRRLRDALRAAGHTPQLAEAPDGTHDEASWAARVAPMLRFLYGNAPR